MKYFYAFYLIFCLVSCKTKVVATESKQFSSMACPENGSCSFEILENKSLQTKTDNLGSIYPEIVNSETHFVLKFEYKKQVNSDYADSSYREEIFIELDKNNLVEETLELKDRKLFFARWCYCKGETGYYKINNGTLSIIKIEDKKFQLHLSFKIEEVPQIINELNHTINLQ